MKTLSDLAILVVEDDPVEALRLESVLARMGCAVTLAADGDTALARAGDSCFDVILMDLVLPGLDGMGVLRALAARGIGTPVVAAVTSAGLDAAADALRAGAKDFVVKPAGALRLQVALGNAVALGGATRPAVPRPAAQSPSSQAPLSQAPAWVDPDGHVRPLAEIADEAIRYALARYEGRLTEVARRLGIGRSTLYRRISGRDPGGGTIMVNDHLAAEPVALQFVAAE